MEKDVLLKLVKDLLIDYQEGKDARYIRAKLIEKLLFIELEDGTKLINEPMLAALRYCDIDMSDVSFKNARIRYHNLSGYKNIHINIQEISNQDLSEAYLEGVYLTGSLKDACIRGTNFKGYIGNLVLNPQECKDKDLWGTNLAGVTIDGSFDDVRIIGTKFKGAKGEIRINPQTVKYKAIINVDFKGIELVGDYNPETNSYGLACFDGCVIKETSFEGCPSKVIIDPQQVFEKRMEHCNVTGVVFDGSYEGVDFFGTTFINDEGEKIYMPHYIDDPTFDVFSLIKSKLTGKKKGK